MAVDPKQIIQRNIPLVLCYVAAIVPVVLWVLFVVGGVQGGAKDSYRSTANVLRAKKNALESLAKQIQANPAEVYTPDHKKKFTDRNQELQQTYDNMIKLLSDRDNALERWLPDFANTPKDKEPPASEFQAKLTTEIENLHRQFKDIVEDPSTKAVYIALEPAASGNLKKLQKQLWMIVRVLEGLKKSGTPSATDPVPVRLLSNIEFSSAPNYQSGQVGPDGKPLAKPLMVPIPVKIIVQMSLRDVPKVVRELLAQDVVFRLKSLHTELMPFGPISKADISLTVNADPKPLYDRTIYNVTLASQDKTIADEEAVLPEPKLKVTIELEAIDFDMDAIAPPAAAAAGSGK